MRKMIEGFHHKMGTNCMTCALSDVSNFNGYDWDEDFCLGISGALSFWYSKEKMFIQATGVGNNIFDEFAAVTRVQHGVYETSDNIRAWRAAKGYIDNNIPIVLDVELMAYYNQIVKRRDKGNAVNLGFSKLFRIGGHVTCMSGYDDTGVYINENFLATTVRISKNTLKKARNPRRIDFVPPRNKLHFFIFPDKLADSDYLINTAIVRVIQNMENPFTKRPYLFEGLNYDSSGLFGMNEMFDDIEKIVRSDDEVERRRLLILNAVLNRWGASEFNRVAYGRFLRQAYLILKDPKYRDAADAYNECGREWKIFLKDMNRFCSNSGADWNNLKDSREALLGKEKAALDTLHAITHF